MLRWSLMLFALSLTEGTLGHSNSMIGSAMIAKVSFVAALSLLILFHHHAHKTE
jgi:uncharacterized membrane protein YtjA (UPF0391 family)